ncbi:hypothetical protein EDB83DRAFT_2417988, partial [Lactarius deliciosus]
METLWGLRLHCTTISWILFSIGLQQASACTMTFLSVSYIFTAHQILSSTMGILPTYPWGYYLQTVSLPPVPSHLEPPASSLLHTSEATPEIDRWHSSIPVR